MLQWRPGKGWYASGMPYLVLAELLEGHGVEICGEWDAKRVSQGTHGLNLQLQDLKKERKKRDLLGRTTSLEQDRDLETAMITQAFQALAICGSSARVNPDPAVLQRSDKGERGTCLPELRVLEHARAPIALGLPAGKVV